MHIVGGNFEFFPPNSRLTVVEPNAFFEPMFYERQSKFPSLKMERFVLAKAEDMKDIEDGSIDIVVSTLVLCSVESVEKTLSEVERVLAPVRSSNRSSLKTIQASSILFIYRVVNITTGNTFTTFPELGFTRFKLFALLCGTSGRITAI